MTLETALVAVPLPLRGLFHYRVPSALSAAARPGCRVRVRFAGRIVVGYVVDRDTPPPADRRLAAIDAVLDDALPTFDGPLLAFLQWVAVYYHAPLGEVLRGAHPPGTGETGAPGLSLTAVGRAALEAGHVDAAARPLLQALAEAEGAVALTELELPDPERLERLLQAAWLQRGPAVQAPEVSTRLERVVRAVAPAPAEARGPGGRPLKRDLLHAALVGRGGVSTRSLAEEFPNASAHIRQLVDEGSVVVEAIEVQRDPFFGEVVARDRPPTLTEHQRQAVSAILRPQASDRPSEGRSEARTPRAEGYVGFLLQGITGSGKTEVYLHAIEAVLQRGQGALVLVPEIALTPQLVRRFRARLGDAIAVLHSGLSRGARFDQWRRLRQGQVKVAIGARSAVFAPVAELGLIVVDEEHDPSFKQHEGVRYHARDLALARAARVGAVVVLGSATPSLESTQGVARGRLKRLLLPSRPGGAALPRVELVDLRIHRAPDALAPFLSQPLRDALTATLARGEQAILFLNRRGFSTFVLCEACGRVLECPECAISLTWHRRRHRLVCHYSDHSMPLPEVCPHCQQRGTIRLHGQGTERVEDALATLHPGARIERLDRDTAGGNRLAALEQRMRRREIDILVGTQMVTKGHDFPDVTLVGVLAADASLQFPDFRAGERTFQLLSQVAGRAGRAQRPGVVLIQTWNPAQPVLQAVATHDYAAFAAAALEDRRLAGYPPFSHALAVRIDGTDEGQVAETAQEIGAELRRQGAGHGLPLHLRGPAPMPLAFLRGHHRWSLLLTATQREPLHRLARLITAYEPRGVRVVVDIDPYDFL